MSHLFNLERLMFVKSLVAMGLATSVFGWWTANQPASIPAQASPVQPVVQARQPAVPPAPPAGFPATFRIRFTTDAGSNVDVIATSSGGTTWTSPSVSYRTSWSTVSGPVMLVLNPTNRYWYIHLEGGDQNFGVNSGIGLFDPANPASVQISPFYALPYTPGQFQNFPPNYKGVGYSDIIIN